MSTTYTIQKGDVLLLDINTAQYGSGYGSTLVIPTWNGALGGLAFNFNPGADVQKNLQKNAYVVQKPGTPVGYDIGLGERVWTITTTIKQPVSVYSNTLNLNVFRSLFDLNALCNLQYSTIYTYNESVASNGVLNFFYYGDRVLPTLNPVVCTDLWYEQRPGGGSIFDVRVTLSEVVHP